MAIKREEGGSIMSDIQTTGQASVSKATVDTLANKGKEMRKIKNQDELALEGSASDTLIFVNALGNPKARDTMNNSYKVVGYVLKSTKPVSVPTVDLYDKKYIKFGVLPDRQVPANQEFTVNNFELGMLLSRAEYAGQILGGDRHVVLSATHPQSKSNERAGTASEYIPNLKVFGGVKGQSVKDGMVLIGDKVTNPNTHKEEWKVKPEYEEAFGIFLRDAVRGGGKNQISRDKGEQAKNLAAALNSMYSDLLGKEN